MPCLAGKFVVIEGLEGAGKSTAVNTVIEFLGKRQIKAIRTREPGGTDIGEVLRSLIKNPDYKGIMDDKSELLLLYTSRIQLIEQVIKPALKQGIWVVADRFELSTLAYQGGGRSLDVNFINTLSDFSLGGFKPDLTVFLDISPETGMQRVRLRGEFDRIEQQSIDFFHRVYQTYRTQLENNPDIAVIDAAFPLEEVQDAIKNKLSLFLEQQV